MMMMVTDDDESSGIPGKLHSMRLINIMMRKMLKIVTVYSDMLMMRMVMVMMLMMMMMTVGGRMGYMGLLP